MMFTDSETDTMNARQAFARLRDVLAGLYGTVDSTRRIVYDAGLDELQITFSSKSQDNWHSILREADKQGRVEQLILVALADYKENVKLQEAWEAYQQAGDDNKDSIEPGRHDTDRATGNKITAGKRGIAVGGNASNSTFITGDNNTVTGRDAT